MTPANKINEMLKANAKQAKKLFDLCEKNDEGVYHYCPVKIFNS